MTKRTYPRIGASRKFKARKNNQSRCAACGDKATHLVVVEVNYMRGDDDVTNACEVHKNDICALLDGLERIREEQAVKRQEAEARKS